MMEQLPVYAFYFFGGMTLLCALLVLMMKNLLYAAVALLGSLLGVAGVFVLSGADFVAVTQVVVYVGGIMILILFGIMLSKRKDPSQVHITSGFGNKLIGLLAGAGLFAVFTFVIPEIVPPQGLDPKEVAVTSTVNEIGKDLMTTYVLPFELAAILLLIALIGALHIAGKKERGEEA